MDNILNCNLKKQDAIILKLPDNIAVHRQNRSVAIDREIVEVIKHLWANNIQTLGSCCGHKKENPNIVIEALYSSEDVINIRRLIFEKDSKAWDILQWKLINV